MGSSAFNYRESVYCACLVQLDGRYEVNFYGLTFFIHTSAQSLSFSKSCIMLRRVAIPLHRAATRRLSAAARRPRLHLPLGAVPSSTDLDAVRSKWGSNAMDKIHSTAPIEVDADVAICNGGGGALGHPVEYIKLLVSDEDAGPQVCKYCGLKFLRKHHH